MTNKTSTARPQAKTAKRTATSAYAAASNDIARLLDVLQMELDRHAEEARADPLLWGRVADLDLVRSNLIDTVAFIGGAKMEREDIERFLAEAE